MHVIVRGNARQVIFADIADHKRYLSLLERFCTETGVKVCAYCLMKNHAHMLLSGECGAITLMMHKLGTGYAGYFNRKYDRVGHLFQDRFKSEPVENEAYLITVFRYILQNPQKAGICAASKYRWSSYPFYDDPPGFMDLSAIRELLGSKNRYVRFIAAANNECCLEFETDRHDDAWALAEIKRCLGVENVTDLQKYSRSERNRALACLIKRGLSIRQIERLTGINRNKVQRAARCETA